MAYKTTSKDNKTVAGLILLMSLILATFIAQRPVFLIAGAFLCAIYATTSYWPIKVSKSDFQIFLIICLLFMPAFMKPYHGFSPIFYVFSTISTFFAAKAVSSYKPEILLAVFRIIYTSSVIAIAIILYKYWGHPEPFGMVIEGSSTNGIPAYLIVIQISLSLCSFLVHGRLPILSVIITGVVAFFGNGRGSLVVTILLILISLILNLKLMGLKSRKRQFYYILALIVLLAPLIYNAEELIDSLFSYTKLSVGLEDENRIEILNDYIGKINLYTFIFGADYAGTVIEYKLLGNPHIAYIRAHSFFGFPIMIMAFLSPIFVFFSNKTPTSKIVFSSFIGLAALRAGSEPIFFPTLLDFFYFNYFFLYFRYAQNK